MRYEGGILGMQPTELVLFQLLGTNAHKITGLGESWLKKTGNQKARAAARFGASIRAASFKQARAASQMHIQGTPSNPER